MFNFRPLISILLVLVTTLLVSCGGGPEATNYPTTYSPEKIAQLQVFVKPIEAAQGQFVTLKEYIVAENWVDTRTYIHGPLGALRGNMLKLSSSLLPKDQDRATALAKKVFGDLEALDAVAKDRQGSLVEREYQEALNDFNAFLDLIPKE